MTRAARALGVAVCVLVACSGEKTFDPPDREARVAAADSLFSARLFDTVTWATPEERADAGNAVYAAHCRTCHGATGDGGTAYSEQRGLAVPSLVLDPWPLGAHQDSVRHRIFVGHAAGMPTWGVAGITVREIDAVTHYLVERLRPEVLGVAEPATR